jgi:hypothetical protein
MVNEQVHTMGRLRMVTNGMCGGGGTYRSPVSDFDELRNSPVNQDMADR